jgi:hypothetical protein
VVDYGEVHVFDAVGDIVSEVGQGAAWQALREVGVVHRRSSRMVVAPPAYLDEDRVAITTYAGRPRIIWNMLDSIGVNTCMLGPQSQIGNFCANEKDR